MNPVSEKRGRLLLVNGRQDRPTDAVRDFSNRLAATCEERGWIVRQVSLDWEADGWFRVLSRLWKVLGEGVPGWVALQVTPLTWSRYGFTAPVLIVAGLVRARGWRLASVLHDPSGWVGPRFRDTVRIQVQ